MRNHLVWVARVAGTCGLMACSSDASGPATGGAPNNGGGNASTGGFPGAGGAMGATGGAAGAGGMGAAGGSAGAGGMVGGGGTGGGTGGGGGMGVAGAGTGTGGAVNGIDAGVPGPDGGSGSSERPPCMMDARQVIVLGDSYVNWVSHTFPQDLASTFGQGAQGVWDVPYGQGGRLYATGAWAMGSGGLGLIPDQLGFATSDDPDIIASVMTGGGNDFLVPAPEWPGGAECKNSSDLPPAQVCQDIAQTAFDAATDLMHAAADAGIRDVVYFFYPNVPEPTLIGGTSPNTILEWSYPRVRALCEGTEAETGGRLRCHFLDTRPVFENHPEYFAAGDIHPNATGSSALAAAVVDLMEEKCIAQPASSGCCEL